MWNFGVVRPFCRAVGIVAAYGLFAVAAGAQDLLSDMTSGPPNGRYAFASSTPKTLADLIQGPGQGEPAAPVGHLFLPPASTSPDKLGAVILIHGSGGIYDAMLDFWPRQFNAAGLAVLAVDSFGPRGVKSTADDQSLVPFGADTADAFAALRLLATHPRIDPKRIAIMGFSRGGITTWRTAVERIVAAQKLPNGLRFAAHVPVYSGGCGGIFRLQVKPGVFSTAAPMLWIHGDADDYAPMVACRDYAERIGKAGTPVEFLVIPGALHKFDMDDTRRTTLRGAQKTLETCPLEVDIDTLAVLDRNTGQRLTGVALQATLKQSCNALGASVQGDRAARDLAAQTAVAFLRRVLAPR